jgi:hypothetical protein
MCCRIMPACNACCPMRTIQLPLLVRFSLGLVLLQGCQLPMPDSAHPASQNPAASSPTTTDTPNTPNPELSAESELLIVLDPLLPELNLFDTSRLRSTLTTGVESWFGLAGLGKLSNPPPLSADLQSYRQGWMTTNPEIAPFLGLWQDDQDSQNRYYISLFPSQLPGKACVLEFKPEWSLRLVDETGQPTGYKDVISPEILSFSVALVDGDQLRSSQVSMARGAMVLEQFILTEPYPVELMSVLDEEGTIRVLAAADLPRLPPELPDSLQQEVLQVLADQQCVIDRMGPNS